MYGDRRVMVRLHPRCGALLFGLPCHVRRALRTWHVRDGARCGARGAAHGARLTVSSFRDLMVGSGQRRAVSAAGRRAVRAQGLSRRMVLLLAAVSKYTVIWSIQPHAPAKNKCANYSYTLLQLT